MKKLSDKRLKELKDKGLIVKRISSKKPEKKTVPAEKSVESSLQEMTGYVKTIVTKTDNVKIAMESSFKVAKVLDMTVKRLSELKPAGQVTEWDITVERDRYDFIEKMNIKAVSEGI